MENNPISTPSDHLFVSDISPHNLICRFVLFNIMKADFFLIKIIKN